MESVVKMKNRAALAEAHYEHESVDKAEKLVSIGRGGRLCWNKAGTDLLNVLLDMNVMTEPVYLSIIFSEDIEFTRISQDYMATRMSGMMYILVFKGFTEKILSFKTFLYDEEFPRLTSKVSAMKIVFGTKDISFMAGDYGGKHVSPQKVISDCKLDATLLPGYDAQIKEEIKKAHVCLKMSKLT